MTARVRRATRGVVPLGVVLPLGFVLLLGAVLVAEARAEPEAAPAPAAGARVPAAASAEAVVVEADQGIEWQREQRLVIARGNATAVRGSTRVRGDVLRAFYRDKPDGSADIYRLDAEGGVKIDTPGQSAFGEKAVYELDKERVVLSGGRQVGLTTGASRITAERELEYDTRQRTLIARGNAVAYEKDRTIHGDVITAYLREGGAGEDGLAVRRLTAEKKVRVITPEEEFRGDRGTYDLDTGVATLTGAVQITRGENVLNGCRGEMNVRTGVSRLFACEGGAAGGGRVRGVIVPEQLRRE